MAGIRKDAAWVGGGAVVSALVILASYLLFIAPQNEAKADSQSQLENARVQNEVLKTRLDSLRRLAEGSDAMLRDLAKVRSAIPSDHDLDAYTRQLSLIAEQSNVELQSITPTAPTEVEPLEGEESTADQIFAVGITLETVGMMEDLRAFLAKLERSDSRVGLVTNLSFAPFFPPAVEPALDEDGNPIVGDDEDPSVSDDDDESDSDDGESDDDSSTPAAGDDDEEAEEEVIVHSATEGEWQLTAQITVFVAPGAGLRDAALREIAASLN